MMTKKKRIISLLIAVALLFVMLYSALYIAAESNHICIGENCPVCYQINACENALKFLSLTVCTAGFAAVLAYVLYISISACINAVRGYTLILLKVKLTD